MSLNSLSKTRHRINQFFLLKVMHETLSEWWEKKYRILHSPSYFVTFIAVDLTISPITGKLTWLYLPLSNWKEVLCHPVSWLKINTSFDCVSEDNPPSKTTLPFTTAVDLKKNMIKIFYLPDQVNYFLTNPLEYSPTVKSVTELDAPISRSFWA